MKKRKKDDKIHSSKTIFDDVFRTILEKAPELILPVINEVFHTDYRAGEPFIQMKNEHVDGAKRVITDSCLRIRGKEYHMESQSFADGSMAVRMVEYDFLIALENIHKQDGTYEMAFPHSCVLYLRGRGDMADSLNVRICFPGGEEVLYAVPVMKVQEYTLQEIFDKRFLFLIPFYLMRYEERLGDGQQDVYRELWEEYSRIYEELAGLLPQPELADDFALLVELTNRIVEHILPEGGKRKGWWSIWEARYWSWKWTRLWPVGSSRELSKGLNRGSSVGSNRYTAI